MDPVHRMSSIPARIASRFKRIGPEFRKDSSTRAVLGLYPSKFYFVALFVLDRVTLQFLMPFESNYSCVGGFAVSPELGTIRLHSLNRSAWNSSGRRPFEITSRKLGLALPNTKAST